MADADDSALPPLMSSSSSPSPSSSPPIIHSLIGLSIDISSYSIPTVEHITKLIKGKTSDGKKIINGYTIEKSLGEGAYATVDLIKKENGDNNNHNQEYFALKKMSKKQSIKIREYMQGPGGRPRMSNALEKIRREIAIMEKLFSPHIIKLIKVLDDPDEDPLYLFLEYAEEGQIMEWNGDKKKYQINNNNKLKKNNDTGGIEEEELKRILIDILDAIQYIHSLKIIHRDIKPDNLLLDRSLGVKLCDFGVAREFSSSDDGMISDTQGTYHFFSPEMCTGKKYSGYMADIWALGISLYCMIYTTLPFISDDNNAQELFDMIANKPIDYPKGPSEQLLDLLKNILEKDPNKRYTIKQIREHPWLKDASGTKISSASGGGGGKSESK